MRTENGCDDQHRIEAALERDRGLLAPTVEDGFEMLDLGLEIVGPSLGQELLLDPFTVTGDHRVEAGLVVDPPFDEAVAALDAAELLGRRRDDVLDDLADQPLGGPEGSEHQPVVIDLAIRDHVEEARDLLNLAGAENAGEMLPDVDAMRMLARGATASRGKAEIALGGTGEPGMGLEDAAPMLAGARRDGDGRPDRAGPQQLFGKHRVAGQGMVVADAGEDPERLRSTEERRAALEVGTAKRLLDQ